MKTIHIDHKNLHMNVIIFQANSNAREGEMLTCESPYPYSCK